MKPVRFEPAAHRSQVKLSTTELSVLACLFDSLRPINDLSVKQGRVFLGLTSTKLG